MFAQIYFALPRWFNQSQGFCWNEVKLLQKKSLFTFLWRGLRVDILNNPSAQNKSLEYKMCSLFPPGQCLCELWWRDSIKKTNAGFWTRAPLILSFILLIHILACWCCFKENLQLNLSFKTLPCCLQCHLRSFKPKVCRHISVKSVDWFSLHFVLR